MISAQSVTTVAPEGGAGSSHGPSSCQRYRAYTPCAGSVTPDRRTTDATVARNASASPPRSARSAGYSSVNGGAPVVFIGTFGRPPTNIAASRIATAPNAIGTARSGTRGQRSPASRAIADAPATAVVAKRTVVPVSFSRHSGQ